MLICCLSQSLSFPQHLKSCIDSLKLQPFSERNRATAAFHNGYDKLEGVFESFVHHKAPQGGSMFRVSL